MTTLDDSKEFENEAKGHGMSRRALVRTGAVSAAAVPAITIASAAPALANTTSGAGGTTGGTILLSSWNPSPKRSGADLDFGIAITNTTATAATGLTISVTITPINVGKLSLIQKLIKGQPGALDNAQATSPAGWSVVRSQGSLPLVGGLVEGAVLGSVTFYYSYSGTVPGNSTITMSSHISIPTASGVSVVAVGQAAGVTIPGLQVGLGL